MGREQRREVERMRNKMGKMQNVTMTRDELNDLIAKKANEAAAFNVEALMTCFALAEHRLYGYGNKRIFRSLSYIDALMGAIINDSSTIDDYKEELKNETNVVITCHD